MELIKKIIKYPLFQNTFFLFALWLGIALAGYLTRLHYPVCNNYIIFSHSFWHALNQEPLYIEYPQEYFDLFLYGIPFTTLIAPFSLLPDRLGSLFWVLANCCILFWAIRQLSLKKWQFAFLIWFSSNELFLPILAYQYSIGIAAMLILSYAFIDRKREFWAALMIVLGATTKVYGIMGLAFFLFSKRKIHLLWGLLFWVVVVYGIPMLYTSPEYVSREFVQWLDVLRYKHDLNTFCSYTNISLLGMIRKITNSTTYSDLWIIVSGLILFVAPYFRLKQYEYKSFRMLFLSSVLLFMVLFSSSTEGCGYIAAILGVCIWYLFTPTNGTMRIWNTFLLIFCFLLTSLSPTDLFPMFLKKEYIVPYALKALPCTLIWLKIIWELLTQDFSKERLSACPVHVSAIDVILPCHNPHKGWEQVMIEKYAELRKALAIDVRFIVVNDGSTRGFSSDAVECLCRKIPETIIVDNKVNQGKGAAVRDGLARATADFIIYTDYDFPYEIYSICEVVKLLRDGNDIVIANRNKTYYSQLTLKRKIMSHTSRLLNFMLLGLTHTDTQGGLKGFNKKGKRYLESTSINRFLFDTEFIYSASKDSDIRIVDTFVNLRDHIILPNMKKGVLIEELKNLFMIAWRG